MNEIPEYKLANIQKKELRLRSQRLEILAQDAEAALDMILDAPSPATLVQSFPDPDLYYLMHKIGPDDFVPVLSMATSTQWEYILDVEVWDGDRLDIDQMTKGFDLLFQADPQRFLRWVIKEKPDFLEFYLFKNMVVHVREHDEPPPEDFDDYITLDDKFYFRFPDKPPEDDPDAPEAKEGADPWELIEKMMKLLAGMDLSVFHGLMLETTAVLTAEVEEEQYRLKNLRLAEKGFLPTHEAIGIYQGIRLDSLRRRPDTGFAKDAPYDPDLPLPPQFFSPFLKGDNLFVKALQGFDPDAFLVLESELAALINKVISADKIKLRARQDLEKAIKKTCAYLNLGLEAMLKENALPDPARDAIREYFLEDIFRVGSKASISLKTRAQNWFTQSYMNREKLPLSFLGETYLGIVGGLMLERPLFFDNYAAGELYRNFETLSDIKTTEKALETVMALDRVLDLLNADIASFKEGILTYKTLILTLWAKDRLGLEPTLDPIDTDRFKDFFTDLFSGTGTSRANPLTLDDLTLWIAKAAGIAENALPGAFKEIIQDLISELEEEYGTVRPKDIDPRFIPHFILKKH